jgi:hypothetical protein
MLVLQISKGSPSSTTERRTHGLPWGLHVPTLDGIREDVAHGPKRKVPRVPQTRIVPLGAGASANVVLPGAAAAPIIATLAESGSDMFLLLSVVFVRVGKSQYYPSFCCW